MCVYSLCFPVWQTVCHKHCSTMLSIPKVWKSRTNAGSSKHLCMSYSFCLLLVLPQLHFRQPFQIKSQILPSTQTAARLKNKWFCCRCHLALMHSLGGGHLAVSTISAFMWHSFNTTGGGSRLKMCPCVQDSVTASVFHIVEFNVSRCTDVGLDFFSFFFKKPMNVLHAFCLLCCYFYAQIFFWSLWILLTFPVRAQW